MTLANITVNTQSSIRIGGSKVLYFDPYLIPAVSRDADLIFITHEHYDHFEPESIAKLQKEETLLVAPESMKKKALSELGMAEENCLFYQPGESFEAGGIAVETIPAYNKLKPFHPKGKKWQGYVVTMDDTRYYVSGDTDVNEDITSIKAIGDNGKVMIHTLFGFSNNFTRENIVILYEGMNGEYEKALYPMHN